MDIDWLHLMWQGRWEALVLIWHALVTDAQTFWWFGPLIIVVVIAGGRKGVLRLATYVLKVFVHTHGPS